VGAIAPSSQVLAEAMLEGIAFAPDARIVELGPGTGSFTAQIARRLPPAGRYLGIEREPAFVDLVRKRWPALDCHCGSVVDLAAIARERGLLPIDHIVSGLPFASLPAETTMATLDAVREVLRPSGTFTTFQYVHAYGLAAASRFRREMERRFGPPEVRSVVFWNLPPAFVLTWRKEG